MLPFPPALDYLSPEGESLRNGAFDRLLTASVRVHRKQSVKLYTEVDIPRRLFATILRRS